MELDLNGTWECLLPDGRMLALEVPGCWETCVEEKDIAERVRLTRYFELKEIVKGSARLWFGAVSYYCDIYLNGQKVGSHEGMWDSFWVDVTGMLRKGENELVLDLWKPGYHSTDRFPLREVLSGFLPDVLSTFGGIWKAVCLETAAGYFLDRHWAEGDVRGNAEVTLKLWPVQEGKMLHLTGEIRDQEGACVARIDQRTACEREVRAAVLVEEPQLWSPDHPVLYQYHITLDDGEEKREISGSFGFREIRAEGTKILLNERMVYARGILHWGYYEGIVPTPDDRTVCDEITRVRSFGFNMIKHCLYLPGENYLRYADELGMLLWIELPLWLPDKTEELEKRIYREFPALMEQIAGHPSVAFVSLGCELDDKVDSRVLEEMYLLAKEKLKVLIRDNSGSGECYGGLAVDFADFSDYHFYADLQNMENLLETFTPVWKRNRPWLFGEFCDSDTLRDMKALREARGVDFFDWEKQDASVNPISILKPDFFLGNHDERMEQSGIRKEYPLLRELSCNHSMVHRKTTLEQVRAFQEIGGYNITSIRDVPIATSGLFDDLMQEKFDPGEFQIFNGDVMLVPAWDLTRVWINSDRVMPRERYGFFGGEQYGMHLLVSDYGASDLKEPVITYRLQREDGEIIRQGERKGSPVSTGTVSEVCYLNFDLPMVKAPESNVLAVTLSCDGITVHNEWPVFLYPKPSEKPWRIGVFDPIHVFDTVEHIYADTTNTDGRSALSQYDVMFCSLLTPEIIHYAEEGGKVFYVQRGEGSLPVSKVAFWREGMIRKADHPVMEEIGCANWMDDLRYFCCATDTAFSETQDPRFHTRRPILRRYDCREWRADDYLMELGCGKGRIIATTLRLEGGMGKQPMFLENNRLGRWLLDRACTWLITGDTHG